ncbi:unnamed protein product [Musa banksii]
MTHIIASEPKAWGVLSMDILLEMVKELNPIDRGSVGRVCHSWRKACRDSSVWRMVDLRSLRSNLVWVDTNLRLSQALRSMEIYGHVNIRCIILHPHLHVKDEHFNLIARGCPRLKRLVVPRWEVISKNGMCNAMKNCRDLESLTMPGNACSLRMMKTMSVSCKSFSELKVIGCFPRRFGMTVALYLPGLKVLSLRCCRTSMVAIEMILGSMDHLEVLNLSHAMVQLEVGSEVMPLAKGFEEMAGKFVLEKASSMLSSFWYCENYVSCGGCRRMMDRRLRHENGFWWHDEVVSLDLGKEAHDDDDDADDVEEEEEEEEEEEDDDDDDDDDIQQDDHDDDDDYYFDYDDKDYYYYDYDDDDNTSDARRRRRDFICQYLP